MGVHAVAGCSRYIPAGRRCKPASFSAPPPGVREPDSMAMQLSPARLGIKAPDFSLPATDGRTVRLADVAGRNGTVAISSNEAKAYPEDSFEKMKALAAAQAFPLPYLYDESQEVARAYEAV